VNKPFVVFIFDVNKPAGGWEDVLCKENKVVRFEDADTAAKLARRNLPKNGKYQVVDLRTGSLIGSGGHKTGRRPLK
jgi:hypothetical protein